MSLSVDVSPVVNGHENHCERYIDFAICYNWVWTIVNQKTVKSAQLSMINHYNIYTMLSNDLHVYQQFIRVFYSIVWFMFILFVLCLWHVLPWTYLWPPQKKYVKNIMTTDKHWRHYKTEILLKCFIAWSLMWSY